MFSDLRFALRQFAKSPGFTIVAVLTLALGIGMSTTIFNAANPLLFRPLPFDDPNTLVSLSECNLKQGFERMNVSYADFTHWRRENQVFSELGIWDTSNFTLGDVAEPERIAGCTVSSRLFATLRQEPALGRGFAENEDSPGAPATVLLGDALWRRRFEADPNIIGQTITLNGTKRTVIGIMPPRMRFPLEADLWVPLVVDQPERTHGNHSYSGVGRLKPGVSLMQAKGDLVAIHERLAKEHPSTNANLGPLVRPVEEGFINGELRTMGWTMLGTVAFVLAVACANIASLLLARALGRQNEFAIRQALGAGRWRTIRQLLVESLVLGVAGGALGFVFSLWGLGLIMSLIRVDIPYWLNFSHDGRVIAFAGGISLLTSILFGLAPAWQASGVNVQAGLSETGRGSGGNVHRQRLRSLLVVGQIAMATLLLYGTGLMIRSLINLQRTDPGFNPARLAVFHIDLNSAPDSNAAARTEFFNTFTERLRVLPGVQSVALCSHLPLTGRNNNQGFGIVGRPPPGPGENPVGNLRVVTPGYFNTMEIPLLRGRDFADADSATAAKVIIIDASFAKRHFGESNPLGQHIRWDLSNPSTSMEIIGIAADVKHSGLDRDSRPGFYVPNAQNVRRRMSIVVRTATRDPMSIAPAVRQALRETDPTLALFNSRSMMEIIGQSYWMRYFLSKLMALFAVLAMALVAVGIAGMVAFSVAQRTRDIGVRMALGAQSRDILALILGQGMRLVLCGLGLGFLASFGLGRLLASQLYGVGSADPITLAVSTVIFAAIALLACWLPARRATHINPVEALRAD